MIANRIYQKPEGKEIVTLLLTTYDPHPLWEELGLCNQRAANVAGARKNVGTPGYAERVWVLCFMQGIGHVSRNVRKPENEVKDASDTNDESVIRKNWKQLYVHGTLQEKFLGTVKFGNDQIAPILGYGDLVQGTITIKRVYYVEGLNHNLFSVGQFCDADLEVAFRKSTCYIRDLKGNDLLTAWLWHRRLSHLNFDTINLLSKNNIVNGLPKLKFVKDHLCSSCELGKAKRKSFHTKTTPVGNSLLRDDITELP
ncbi:retrovirus-related pol polyprotein from transposon TNT 1-94 [Tanacetum coccineum]